MLVPCIECGNHVSDSAKRCPYCRTNLTKVKCFLCTKECPETRAVRGTELGRYHFAYYHPECIEDFKTNYLNIGDSRLVCPDCQKDWGIPKGKIQDYLLSCFGGVGNSLDRDFRSECPFCGRPGIPLRVEWSSHNKCVVCWLGIFPALSGYCERRSGHNFSDSWSWEPASSHYPLCSSILEDDVPMGIAEKWKHYKFEYFAKRGRLLKEIRYEYTYDPARGVEKKLLPNDSSRRLQPSVSKNK